TPAVRAHNSRLFIVNASSHFTASRISRKGLQCRLFPPPPRLKVGGLTSGLIDIHRPRPCCLVSSRGQLGRPRSVDVFSRRGHHRPKPQHGRTVGFTCRGRAECPRIHAFINR